MQLRDELLEWELKLFYFDERKCVQAVNFASKLTLFLFDIKNEKIQWIANSIAIYLNELYSKDKNILNTIKINKDLLIKRYGGKVKWTMLV